MTYNINMQRNRLLETSKNKCNIQYTYIMHLSNSTASPFAFQVSGETGRRRWTGTPLHLDNYPRRATKNSPKGCASQDYGNENQ